MSIINYIGMPGMKQRPRSIKQAKMSMDIIVNAVCGYYRVDSEYFRSIGRQSDRVAMRMVCQWLMITEGGHTKTDIARYFNQDHSTVVHTFKRINRLISVGDYVRDDIHNIKTHYL